MITYTVSGAVIQSVVPDNMRGRVLALSGTAQITFPIGTLIVGILAQLYGAPSATVIFGIMLVSVILLMPILFRGMWSLKTDDEVEGTDTKTVKPDLQA